MLYLVGTPIGNLQDISKRTAETLAACDYILCEDTRHSAALLHHLQIHKPLKSYHKFNEQQTLDSIIEELKAGKEIALISDAGMPAFADPGELLVKRCREEGILVTAIAGPSAAIMALVLSGFATQPFQFVGFLEKKESDFQRQLMQMLLYPGTSVAYESPHRIEKSLQRIHTTSPSSQIFLARELTKLHEECVQGSAEELLKENCVQHPKGEYVLVMQQTQIAAAEETLTPEEEIALFEKEYKLARQEAIKLVASRRGISKRDLYHLRSSQER